MTRKHTQEPRVFETRPGSGRWDHEPDHPDGSPYQGSGCVHDTRADALRCLGALLSRAAVAKAEGR